MSGTGGLSVWLFEVVAAESLGTRRVFTLDRRDFAPYKVRRGHRHQALEIVSLPPV